MRTPTCITALLLVASASTVLASDCGCTYRSFQMPNSCQDIASFNPRAKSGYYRLVDGTEEYYAYCDMGSLCGGKGWTRIADFNRGKPQDCPAGLHQDANFCSRSPNGGGSCNTAYFSSRNILYSEVCGRVIAYQVGTPDAFGEVLRNDINTFYVDGVSITHGFPRRHIWTYAAGLQDTINYNVYTCPCNFGGDLNHKPSFIGDDYYCESGNHDSNYAGNIVYTEDPLFDNEGCRPQEIQCCNKDDLPYFHKKLGGNFTDAIELRICGDEPTSNENVGVIIIELFIR